MSTTEQLAAAFKLRVDQEHAVTHDWVSAYERASAKDEHENGGRGEEAYRLHGLTLEDLGVEPTPEPTPVVVSLSAKTGESFDDVAMRYTAEKNLPLRMAIHEVGRLRPDLAQAR